LFFAALLRLQPGDNDVTSRPMKHAITVDVEDYFHTEAMSSAAPRAQWDSFPSRVVDNTRRLLECFARHEVKGTFFVLGWVAKKFPSLVKEISAAGNEIACHSFWHRAVFRLDPVEFRNDTAEAKKVIEDAGGQPVTGYRAPSFSITPGTEWAYQVLAELGFTYDSSVNPIRHDFYGNPNAPRAAHTVAEGQLVELPIATARLFGQNFPAGGGAYLRLFPRTYFHRAIDALERSQTPGMFYLHPWEVDSDQPRLKVGLKSRFRQYTGLRRMEPNLEKLLARHRFGPVREVYVAELSRRASPRRESLQI
jgi:polysaccharide deacetylase family protein (PEP-CTERM system associated)